MKYKEPEMKILLMEEEDIVCTSNGLTTGGDQGSDIETDGEGSSELWPDL